MKATVLIDNIADNGLAGEWGLSIYIEYGGKNVLLDAGATELFAENAAKLGVSLGSVDIAVLSHAHYDHAGGLREFFAQNDRAKLYIRSGAEENCWGGKWPCRHYIGIPRGLLAEKRERIVFADGAYELEKGAYLLPHSTPGLEETGRRSRLYLRRGLRFLPDGFGHEQSLVFDSGGGLVVFSSCSHGGADNIVRETLEAFPGKRVRAIVGGFHLYQWSERGVRAFAARLREAEVSEIYTGHCTGRRAFELLREELGERVRPLRSGLTMEF